MYYGVQTYWVCNSYPLSSYLLEAIRIVITKPVTIRQSSGYHTI
jgi:hypothetical protein